jgi:hypothetical protein
LVIKPNSIQNQSWNLNQSINNIKNINNSGFFKGSRYSMKIIKQMQQRDFHAFPDSVLAFAQDGKTTTIRGGDGKDRTKLEIPGRYKGKNGTFEFIRESNGVINHRLFVADRTND